MEVEPVTCVGRRRLARMLLVLTVLSGLGMVAAAFLTVLIRSPFGSVCLELGVCWIGVRDYGTWDLFYRIAPVEWYAYMHKRCLLLPEVEWARGGCDISIPAWLPLAVVAPLTIITFRRSRQRPGCCSKCGYNLTGNVSGACPECGAAATAEGEA